MTKTKRNKKTEVVYHSLSWFSLYMIGATIVINIFVTSFLIIFLQLLAEKGYPVVQTIGNIWVLILNVALAICLLYTKVTLKTTKENKGK